MKKVIYTFITAAAIVITANLVVAPCALASTNGEGISAYLKKYYQNHIRKIRGWHNVNGTRIYFPNTSSKPAFTMGAVSVQGKVYKALYVIDVNKRAVMKKTIKNIKNLLNDPRVKGHIRIELIAFSPGVHIYFKGNGFKNALLKLKKDGVEIAECANTLYELHIPPSKLYSFVKMVPSAQGEIVIREAEGWAYLKP
ncbi:MAG: hypothetical protein EVJ47_08110 [Candidatus Acidulodesulfobacterium ferriphilum]|jgi:Uncharacterized conserved protein|uniref:DsrE/DsrF-like family protein n=1 Tax=Candidatus Acidulodesulfobacterium ferriphilum TaxID=2597223 RepID=A0A519BAD3_9DELT|nr:MAG: hypothetical protein EVJ47_08110 [Candidatus Acidulodesulfobacterium ferriphilum]